MERISFVGLLSRSWGSLRGKRLTAIGLLLFLMVVHGAASQIPLVPLLLLPFHIGSALFFLQLAQGKPTFFEAVFVPFSKYWHSLWAVMRPALIIMLWGLLPFLVLLHLLVTVFFAAELTASEAEPPVWLWSSMLIGLLLLPILSIPMIVATYRYILTQYIVCRNPEMPVREAMAQSSALMRGNKFRLFCYQILLSILMVLGAVCTLGIALLWLCPLYQAFYANFYVAVSGDTGVDPEPENAEPAPAVEPEVLPGA